MRIRIQRPCLEPKCYDIDTIGCIVAVIVLRDIVLRQRRHMYCSCTGVVGAMSIAAMPHICKAMALVVDTVGLAAVPHGTRRGHGRAGGSAARIARSGNAAARKLHLAATPMQTLHVATIPLAVNAESARGGNAAGMQIGSCT